MRNLLLSVSPMTKWIMLSLLLVFASPVMGQSVFDATVPYDQSKPGVGLRVATDPDASMQVGVDICRLWNGAQKLTENKYQGGTVVARGPTPPAGTVVPVGCVFLTGNGVGQFILNNGVTANMTVTHVRASDGVEGGPSNVLTVTSRVPVSSPTNLKIAEDLRAIADLIAAGKSLD